MDLNILTLDNFISLENEKSEELNVDFIKCQDEYDSLFWLLFNFKDFDRFKINAKDIQTIIDLIWCYKIGFFNHLHRALIYCRLKNYPLSILKNNPNPEFDSIESEISYVLENYSSEALIEKLSNIRKIHPFIIDERENQKFLDGFKLYSIRNTKKANSREYHLIKSEIRKKCDELKINTIATLGIEEQEGLIIYELLFLLDDIYGLYL